MYIIEYVEETSIMARQITSLLTLTVAVVVIAITSLPTASKYFAIMFNVAYFTYALSELYPHIGMLCYWFIDAMPISVKLQPVMMFRIHNVLYLTIYFLTLNIILLLAGIS